MIAWDGCRSISPVPRLRIRARLSIVRAWSEEAARHGGRRVKGGPSKSARRGAMVAAMDRALQAALSPDVVVDVLPSSTELASSSDTSGCTMLHYARAPVDGGDVWAAPEPVSAKPEARSSHCWQRETTSMTCTRPTHRAATPSASPSSSSEITPTVRRHAVSADMM